MDVLIFLGGVLPDLSGEFFCGRKVALEIIADALGIALAATIKIQHPPVRHRIGDQFPMETALDGINDASHQCLPRVPQIPTSSPNPTTTSTTKITAIIPRTLRNCLSKLLLFSSDM